MDREKVISGWERCRKHTCPSIDSKEYADCEYTVGLYCRQDLLIDDTIALLKEQEDEKKRIMKVIWDTLHEGLSIDTVADQDWVYEQIRHRIEDT